MFCSDFTDEDEEDDSEDEETIPAENPLEDASDKTNGMYVE